MLRLLSLLERLITLPLTPPQDAEDELLTGLADTTRRTYKKESIPKLLGVGLV